MSNFSGFVVGQGLAVLGTGAALVGIYLFYDRRSKLVKNKFAY